MLAPLLLGLVHAIVDASTVTAVMRATHLGAVSPSLAFGMVVGYDVVAFGSQVLFGWFTDRFATPKVAVQVGLALTVAGLLVSPHSALATVLLAGIGNALFHLGAGAMVLSRGLQSAAPSGLFVAPGALGLAFGLFYGTSATRGPLWPLLLLTSVSLLGLFALGKALPQVRPSAVPMPPLAPRVAKHAPLILVLLLTSVTVRSLVGLSAARGYARTELLILGLPIAAFLGKSVGGFLADRLGWLEFSVVALLVSIPFIAVPHSTFWLLVGLLVFQMTMPVTLTATAKLMPHRLATAFGWTCLALIVGALPTMFPFGKPWCTRSLLSAWILIGTASLAFGLHLLEVKPKLLSVSQPITGTPET